jgi:hypothetical protein
MVSSLECKHCDHTCHCDATNGCCQLPHCDCENCEHNALDEFHKNLNNKNGTHIQKQ